MRKRNTLLVVVAILGILLATPAWSALLYSNGSIDGTDTGVAIDRDSGLWASDSFTLSDNSILMGAQVGLWVDSGVIPLTVNWSIGTGPNDTTYGSGTANLGNTLNNILIDRNDVYKSDFSLNGTLVAGTYWLTLYNAVSSGGQYSQVFWDLNNGPSQASTSWLADMGEFYGDGYSGSNYFQIYGTTDSSSVPEPSTLLLVGFGLLGLAGFRRKLKE
jgi:hypothetical protein